MNGILNWMLVVPHNRVPYSFSQQIVCHIFVSLTDWSIFIT